MIKEINKNLDILKKKARPATFMDLQTATNLCDTLKAHKGECVGMAANMIGVPVAIIAFYDDRETLMEMLNPEITEKVSDFQTREGCLSLTGTRPVKRYRLIQVKWQDRSFKTHSARFTGFTAEIIQHEVDHLNGLII